MNKFNIGELTQNANNWLRPSSGAAAVGVTVQQYLDNAENYPPLIFDKLTTKGNEELKFSITEGEEQITLSDENYPLLIDSRGEIAHTLDNIGDYDSVLKSTRYLPFFQAYNRDLKVGDYKPNGLIDAQIDWHASNRGGGITPIYNGHMCCALCGRRLEQKRTGEISYDVDRVWNLILDSLLGVLDSPEGYFDTHDTCNRNFKTDKVFVPNIGVWIIMMQKALRFDSVKASKYRWPGEEYGLQGLSTTIPEGGFKTFTIGYIADAASKLDYQDLNPQL